MAKPKIYELWYNDYDGGSSYQFTHPKNKFKAEFQQDCQDTLRQFADAYINEHDSWIGTSDLVELISKNLPTLGYIPFDEVFENISFGMGGSGILQPTDYDDGSDMIKKLLGDDLLQKAYLKNKTIQQRL